MRPRLIRFVLVLAICGLVVAPVGKAAALPQARSDCQQLYDVASWLPYPYNEAAARALDYALYTYGPAVYRFFENTYKEPKRPPDYEHGEISYYIYHLQFDQTVALNCPQ